MKSLVDSLGHLSGLRDREKLDFALVTLVRELGIGELNVVRLIRAVGEMGDQRWQMCASLSAGQEQPARDRGWADWETLPSLAAYPERNVCLVTGTVQRLQGAICITIFPSGRKGKLDGLLELESVNPLDGGAQDLVAGILQIYSNVQDLLDYGEKDSLTDLLNRKTFDGAFLKVSMQQSQTELVVNTERRAVFKGAYWLSVLDIDHFKRVNDTYGHLVGDEVLLLFARLMRSSFRRHDQLYRFGGEEFVVLMRCASDHDARVAVERFRANVEKHIFPQAGSITVSVGFTALTLNDTPGSSFDRADKAVYYAKSHGRNQVCSYQALVASGEIIEEIIEPQEADFF